MMPGMLTISRCTQALALVAAFTWLTDARADIVVPNPHAEACRDRVGGDGCEVDGKAGACSVQKCERRTGGVLNPGVSSYDCTVCDTSLTPSKAEPPAKVAPPSPNSPATAPTPATGATAPTPATGAAPAKPSADSTCNFAGDSTPSVGFAIGVVLLAVASRRPRR